MSSPEIADRSAERNECPRGVAVGDLAGAQRLRLQLVLEFRNFSLLSAAPFHYVIGPSATLVLPYAELH